MDINKELFRRTAPLKKLAIIKSLSDNDLLRTTADTVKRILKEVGSGKYRSRNKYLCFRDENDEKVGNNWNSTIDCVYFEKGELWFDFYVQYDNTDTNSCASFSDVMRRGGFLGQLHRSDRYNNPRTYYFRYDEDNQVKILKAILLTYVHLKYKDKLAA